MSFYTWAERSPVGHGFKNYYRQAANRMVFNCAAYLAAEQGAYLDGAADEEGGRQSNLRREAAGGAAQVGPDG